MDATMRQLIKEVTRLRKEAGITQQDLSAKAGEPCRTFLAHFEQGRKTHINLRKFYGVLHVLYNPTRSEDQKMSETYVTKDVFTAAVDDLNAKIAALEAKMAAPPHAIARVKKVKPAVVPPQFTSYVDAIIRRAGSAGISNQAVLQELLTQFGPPGGGKLSIFSGSRGLKIQVDTYKDKSVRLRGAAIVEYINDNGKEFEGLNTPDKFPHVKFIRLDTRGINAPNPHYKWPLLPAATATVTVTASPPSVILAKPPPSPGVIIAPAKTSNQILQGLTQDETDHAVATFGHGTLKDAGWLYLAHPFLFAQLEQHGRTTKEEIHHAVHAAIEAMPMGARHPTKQAHYRVNEWLQWLGARGHVSLSQMGSDVEVTPVLGSQLASVAATNVATQPPLPF